MKTKGKRSVKEVLQAYCFIAPFVIFGGIFMVYPICNQFIRSMFNTKWGGKTVFVGLENYIEIFTDPIYLKAIGNTLLFVIIAVPALTSIRSMFQLCGSACIFRRSCLW